jgi:predicted kinase
MLLVLNGPPAVGKSTLAQRYADDHPLALVVDVDQLRSQLGRWREVEESKLVARDLAVALTDAHLHAGHDVIVPQFLGRREFIQRLEQVATEAGTTFVELVLTDDPERIIQRFLARRAELAMTGVDHPEIDLTDAEIEGSIRTSNTQLLERAGSSGVTVISVGEGPEAAYRSLRRALTNG